MRIGLALLVVLCVAGSASADSRVTNLVKFYKKEAAVCAKYEAGLAIAEERAQPYVDDKEIADDLAVISGAHAIVRDHCGAIDATLQVLTADPRATYKQLAAAIDQHDAIVRAGRQATRQALEETNPVIQRLIPKINKRRASS
ncbi:MAG TPA: hypothetical protein VLB44_25720 [Kofleriaceae bacterium]|nr:hypothetical protein [Kofleriaceae bacterium]